MAWKIRRELKKHLGGLKFAVRCLGGGWYDIHVDVPSKTLEDAKKALDIRDTIYSKMVVFATENEVILSVTI